MSETKGASGGDDELELVEVEADGVDEGGNFVADDLVVAVDSDGTIIAADETVAVLTADGDIVIDETVSVIGDDGVLHAVEEEISVVEADEAE